MPLDIKKPGCSPSGTFPQPFFRNIAAGSTLPANPDPELARIYEAEHQARYSRSCQALQSSQKRLLIFNQSGNQTRLLRYVLPLHYPSTVTRGPDKYLDLHDMAKGYRKDNFIPGKILLDEDTDENHLNGEESEMHEDTEEINALLYSDEDDYDDDCKSDDEIMSTGHSPPIEEEINSDDGPCKRQKLLDGGKSSLVDTESFLYNKRSIKDKNLPDKNSSSKQEMGSGLSNDQSKKGKIQTAVKILESVVPGATGKDTLLLIDEAIDYLKLLKQNVKSFGFKSLTKPPS